MLIIDDVRTLHDYACNHQIELSNQDRYSTYDIDRLALLSSPSMMNFDRNEIIQYWNLADAICNPLNLPFLGNREKLDVVYDRLFGGCNTAANALEYHSRWEKQEAKLIREMLRECLSILKKQWNNQT